MHLIVVKWIDRHPISVKEKNDKADKLECKKNKTKFCHGTQESKKKLKIRERNKVWNKFMKLMAIDDIR